MATRLCASFCLDEEVGLYEVDRQIAAANSIPEGPPVGTIARRPDGGYIAIMNELGWEYFYLDVRKPRLDTDGDHADSWPQIRPDQWPDQAGLDWFKPGEEPLVPRPDPTGRQEPALRERFPEQASAYVADPELAEVDDEPLPSGSLITPKPRTPRVVDRLGVDEQGSRWRNINGIEYRHVDGRWEIRTGDTGDSWGNLGNGSPGGCAPYAEILEPRVLPSLDCEEARDGTVWSLIITASGTKRLFQYRDGSWHTRLENARWKLYDGAPSLCTTAERFTEVLGDPS